MPTIATPANAAPAKPLTAEQLLTPESESLLKQAQQLQKNKKIDLALAYLNKAIKLSPRSGKLYLNRARVYSDLGKYPLSAKDCNKALELDPALIDAYFDRAWAADHQNDFAGACKDYEKFLSFNPTTNRAFAGCCLADNLGQQGKVDEAIKVLNKTIAYEPTCAQALRLRGNFLNSVGRDVKQAIADYSAAIKLKRGSYRDIYALRAGGYEQVKDYAKAIADYTTVLTMNTADDNIFRKRAAAYEKMGDYKSAIDDYTTSIETNPDWAGPSYFSRARCYKRLGQNALAQKDLDECKKLDYSGK